MPSYWVKRRYGRLLVGFLVSLGLIAGLTLDVSAQEIIRPGDELRVSIPEVGGRVDHVTPVELDGEISLGTYGSISVAGMTVSEAERAIRQYLDRYLRRTSGVTVSLERRERVILVTGQVVAPGLTTLVGVADPWLAIQAAGGAGEGADLSGVVVFRDGEEIPVDIRAYLTREDRTPLPELFLGDVVFVPADPAFRGVEGTAAAFLGEAALRTRVFVLGAVNSPGIYERTPLLNPLMALVLAGGPTANADLSNVRLITMNASERVDLERWMLGEGTGPSEIPTDGGAIMYVPTRSTGTVSDSFTRRVYLMGSIATNGPFEVDGPTPLAELIGEAGGYPENADLEDVHVIRQRERYSLHSHYNLEDYFSRGGAVGSVLVRPGDLVVFGTLPDLEPWERFIGIVRDLALISTSVLVWVRFVERNP